MNTKPGLGSFRKNRTQRPENFDPEKSVKETRTMMNENVLEHPTKHLTSKDLPKSIRLTLDTHSAISTLASIENKKMYEVVTDIVEEYIQNLSPQSKKIVRSSVKAINETKLKK